MKVCPSAPEVLSYGNQIVDVYNEQAEFAHRVGHGAPGERFKIALRLKVPEQIEIAGCYPGMPQ